MIRKVYEACAESKITQNLNSQFWISACDVEEDVYTLTIFNRLFDGKPLTEISFNIDGDCVRVDAIEALEKDVYRVALPHGMHTPTICGYTVDGVHTEVKKFKGYRVEMDLLDARSLSYLRRSYRDFEVFPAISGSTWQCMCSYVNEESFKCERCERLKSENQALVSQGFQDGLLQDCLDQHPLNDGEALTDYSERIASMTGVSPDHVVDEYILREKRIPKREGNKTTEKRNQKFWENQRVKVIWVLVFLVCLFGGKYIYDHYVSPNNQFQEAIALKEAGQYAEAVAHLEAMNGAGDSENEIYRVIFAKYIKDSESLENGGIDNYVSVDANGAFAKYITKLTNSIERRKVQGVLDEVVETLLERKYYVSLMRLNPYVGSPLHLFSETENRDASLHYFEKGLYAYVIPFAMESHDGEFVREMQEKVFAQTINKDENITTQEKYDMYGAYNLNMRTTAPSEAVLESLYEIVNHVYENQPPESLSNVSNALATLMELDYRGIRSNAGDDEVFYISVLNSIGERRDALVPLSESEVTLVIDSGNPQDMYYIDVMYYRGSSTEVPVLLGKAMGLQDLQIGSMRSDSLTAQNMLLKEPYIIEVQGKEPLKVYVDITP